jgi:phage-related minor tail protein
MAGVTFTEWLEQHMKRWATIAGLFSAASGLVAGWAADSALVGAFVGALAVLGAWNVWLWRESRPRKPADAREPRHRRRRR